MSKAIYSVSEIDNNDNILCEFFSTRRDSAIKYLKIRQAILGQELKNWHQEKGVNTCTWYNGDEFKKIKLDIMEIDG